MEKRQEVSGAVGFIIILRVVPRERRNILAMRVREFAKTVDHTLLKPEATEQEIVRLCKEASHHHFAAVCIPPSYVPLAARELRGADVKVATVISFPFGYEATAVKIAAVREAVTRGASELDVVMNISKFLSGEFGYVADELASLTQEVSVVAMNTSVAVMEEAEGGGLQE